MLVKKMSIHLYIFLLFFFAYLGSNVGWEVAHIDPSVIPIRGHSTICKYSSRE